jgi:hypothetical protein
LLCVFLFVEHVLKNFSQDEQGRTTEKPFSEKVDLNGIARSINRMEATFVHRGGPEAEE